MTGQAAAATAPRALIALGYSGLAACRDVVRRVTDFDLARPTPCAAFAVADLGEHLVRSMVLLAGTAGAELTAPNGTNLEERISPLAEATLAAWQGRGFEGDVVLGSRTLPAIQVYSIVLLELVVHGWDLARAIGGSSPPVAFAVPSDLVEYLLEQAPLLILPDKRGRAFADAVAVDADAAPLERLIAFTGRKP